MYYYTTCLFSNVIKYDYFIYLQDKYRIHDEYKSLMRLYDKSRGNNRTYWDLCLENENNEFFCTGGTT